METDVQTRTPIHRPLLGAGLIAVSAFMLPYWVLGQDVHIAIADNLNPMVSTYAAMHFESNRAESGRLPFMLGGLPELAVAVEPKLLLLLYRMLPPFHAYLLNDLIVHLLAFTGMFTLLQGLRHRNAPLAFAVSLSFAFLRFYTSSGLLAVATLPLVLVPARYCLRPRSRAGAIACVVFFIAHAFYSNLSLMGIYILAIMFIVWSVHFFRTRDWAPLYLCCLLLTAGSYVVANWDFISNMFGPHPINWHRAEMDRALHPLHAALVARKLLIHAYWHAPANPLLIWATFAAYALLWVLDRIGLPALRRRMDRGSEELERAANRWVGLLLTAIVFAAAAFFLYKSLMFVDVGKRVRDAFPLIGSLQFHRLYYLYPLLFYALFYFLLWLLWQRGRTMRTLVVLVLVLQIGCNLSTVDWIQSRSRPTYRQFLSARLFDQVEALLPRDRSTYRVACLGFYPSIAHLNGFRTVDGYWHLYPLEHKQRFRKVIRKELEKSEELRIRYDDWGNSIHLISAEFGEKQYIKKEHARPVDNLEIDTTALASLDVSYILSAVLIENHPRLNLEYLGRLEDAEAAIDLHVYSVPR